MQTGAPQELGKASVLDDLSDGFVALDRDWRFTYVNARGAELQGRPAAELLGRRLLEIYPDAAGTPFEHAYRQAMDERVPVHVEAYYPPWDRWFDQHVYPAADGIAVFFVDVTERRRIEELALGQSRILELIAADRPLPESLEALVRVIEAAFPDVLGSVLLLDEDGVHVRHGAAPSLPAEYSRLVDGQPIGPRAGSCGTAMHRGEPVFVEDIESDPLWEDYRPAARAHGLRACWSTPIFDRSRKVLGSFALYFRKPAAPAGQHTRLIEMATHTAATAILKARAEHERDRMLAALRNRDVMFRSLFDSSAIGMTMVSMDQQFMNVNPAFAAMLGYACEELIGRRIDELSDPADASENVQLYRALVAGETNHFQIDKRYRRKDGGAAWGRVTVSRVAQEGSTPSFTIGLIEDITARRNSEQDLQRFRAAMDASGDAILLVDRATLRYVDVNQTFCDLVGYTRDEMLGMTPMDVFSADRATLERDYDAIIADDNAAPSRVEGAYRRKDGREIPIETRRRALRTKDGWIIVGTARDISERKQAEQRIQYLATHDGLTDLPNRNLIHDRIVQAIAHARRAGRQLAVLYLDLDRFKVINDGFGHAFGDAVLRATGERLASLVREGDTVARQGGDEFLVLLADLRKAADAYIVAQKFVENLERPLLVQGREVHVSGSVGVSVFPQDGETPEALISNADVAMYRAKELGRNTYQFFTREMSDETLRRVELENRLRGAAAAGELHLAYQPKVSLADGRITGCEALLRWTHPELGPVSPARFIPIAEDSGLIVPIGDWVLRSACAQNKAWLDAGLAPVTVAVNISARQFLQQDVVAWVKRTLAETGLPPDRLELELTESLIAQDVEKVIATVNELKAAGVKLSIDDFGTGYSSLSYLKRFRVDTLKIDQSFVRNMLTEADDATIVLAVISLAHNLRFKVIAEGVETQEHCRFLTLNRCDEMQGYYFSKPVPAAEMEALLRAGKRLA